jgi:hypothetical protein
MKLLKIAAAASALILSSSAMATVTFYPATGTGFVGKGDVQIALGMNNAQLQANAGSLSFSYVAVDMYTAVCTFTTGEGTRGERTHNVPHKSTTGISATVAYDARSRNQITGFNLTGLSSATVESGEIPVLGGACPGNAGTDGIWSSVDLTSSVTGLNVNYGASSVKIWPPAPVL